MPDEPTTSRSVWVLVCEDDDRLGEQVALGLREAGFTVDLTRNLADAGRHCGSHAYDCLVIDRGLPDGDGLDLVRRQRESGRETPALIITARDSPGDRAAGFDSGADDYLSKPFSLGELAARVSALCARRTRPSPILTVGDLVVDRLRRRVQRGGVLLTVTAREYCTLELLAARAGTPVSPAVIAEYCSHTQASASAKERTIPDTITRLDRKLGAPQLIHHTADGYLLHA
ncbi:response regulator transcription factor [Nocardia sp. 2]|uniref:Response regulator transcription factor n=1 Tax=Nocardia acididurans TaxID=2802282 RepID=A0ABS1MBB1_9NOCA|nr:response regulator transcription factor [Nocardia acididurans]MBL1077861.1 response regulator transcription factor [Nocardia acididurans]